ncbi:hypothetical protein FRC00_004111, partial [Tulasnella sp. 408]
ATLGLNHLHSLTPAICHGDIKPENILINDSGEAALSDFGLSRILLDLGESSGLTTSETPRGSLRYMAPELLEEERPRLNRKTDVYAFGGLILAVMSGKPPFGRLREVTILRRISQGQTPKSDEHPDLPPHDELWNLIRRCWSTNPTTRPTMGVLLLEAMACQEGTSNAVRGLADDSPSDITNIDDASYTIAGVLPLTRRRTGVRPEAIPVKAWENRGQGINHP